MACAIREGKMGVKVTLNTEFRIMDVELLFLTSALEIQHSVFVINKP